MRLVFAGTPDAAVPSLHRLAASAHDIVAVVTRTDYVLYVRCAACAFVWSVPKPSA